MIVKQSHFVFKLNIFLISKIVNGKALSLQDMTLSKMTSDGFKAIFIGIGNPEPKTIPIFKDLTEEQGYFTSKSFLPKVELKDDLQIKILDTIFP